MRGGKGEKEISSNGHRFLAVKKNGGECSRQTLARIRILEKEYGPQPGTVGVVFQFQPHIPHAVMPAQAGIQLWAFQPVMKLDPSLRWGDGFRMGERAFHITQTGRKSSRERGDFKSGGDIG